MPRNVKFIFIIWRPTMTMVPSPVFTPTISAARTPVQAPKKFMRMMTKRLGRMAGRITWNMT
jgi:hypothetical protein